MYLEIQKGFGIPIAKQIYEQLRGMILKGDLTAGSRLLSTRALATDLNISRNTVMTAYEMLIAEGYLNTIPGSGIMVAEGTLLEKPMEKIMDYNLTAYSSKELGQDVIGFYSGTPALDLFPRNKWNKVSIQAMRDAPVSALGYDFPQGRPELRNTLAVYLKKTRGISCSPDQILITSGSKQGLSLVAKTLLDGDSNVWIEDPANANVKNIFSYHTSNISPILVDDYGIIPEQFPKEADPKLIFVTPSHQFPMGGILPIQRRLELINFARKTGAYIVEDDYDSEFRYGGLPISSMQELDRQRVIYVGTFSKTIFPSLRLGFLVLPDCLVEQCREWKRLGDHHTNSLNQLALTRFIESGELERHIAAMRKIYFKRRNILLSKLRELFHDKVSIKGENSGMHIIAEFEGIVFDEILLSKISQAKINVMSVEEHALLKGLHRDQLILGYAHLHETDIEEGLLRLKKVLVSAGVY